MVMRVVPNPGQTAEQFQQEYGRIGVSHTVYPQQTVEPAKLPGSPPFQMPPLQNRSGPAPTYSSGPPHAVSPPGGLPGPIYPGPGWHRGPAVSYTPGYGGIIPDSEASEFAKMFKFGVVDNGILVLTTLAGVGLDAKIAKALNAPRGWGPLIGATIGNALSDGVAAMTDPDAKIGATLGVMTGALAPVVPIFVAATMLKKSPEDRVTQYALMGVAALMTIAAFRRPSARVASALV